MKILDVVFVVIGIIAFIGGLVAAYIFVQTGAALDVLKERVAAGTATGAIDVQNFQYVMDTFNAFLVAGWIWIVAVLLSSGYAIWSGVQKIREK